VFRPFEDQTKYQQGGEQYGKDPGDPDKCDGTLLALVLDQTAFFELSCLVHLLGDLTIGGVGFGQQDYELGFLPRSQGRATPRSLFVLFHHGQWRHAEQP
jgi:hypothetical protein